MGKPFVHVGDIGIITDQTILERDGFVFGVVTQACNCEIGDNTIKTPDGREITNTSITPMVRFLENLWADHRSLTEKVELLTAILSKQALRVLPISPAEAKAAGLLPIVLLVPEQPD